MKKLKQKKLKNELLEVFDCERLRVDGTNRLSATWEWTAELEDGTILKLTQKEAEQKLADHLGIQTWRIENVQLVHSYGNLQSVKVFWNIREPSFLEKLVGRR